MTFNMPSHLCRIVGSSVASGAKRASIWSAFALVTLTLMAIASPAEAGWKVVQADENGMVLYAKVERVGTETATCQIKKPVNASERKMAGAETKQYRFSTRLVNKTGKTVKWRGSPFRNAVFGLGPNEPMVPCDGASPINQTHVGGPAEDCNWTMKPGDICETTPSTAQMSAGWYSSKPKVLERSINRYTFAESDETSENSPPKTSQDTSAKGAGKSEGSGSQDTPAEDATSKGHEGQARDSNSRDASAEDATSDSKSKAGEWYPVDYACGNSGVGVKMRNVLVEEQGEWLKVKVQLRFLNLHPKFHRMLLVYRYDWKKGVMLFSGGDRWIALVGAGSKNGSVWTSPVIKIPRTYKYMDRWTGTWDTSLKRYKLEGLEGLKKVKGVGKMEESRGAGRYMFGMKVECSRYEIEPKEWEKVIRM